MNDDVFIRGKVPMTKSEVRAVSLSKLSLSPNSVLYDIGAGTGSVSVESAMQMPYGMVYAVEQKEEAIELIHKNREKFKLDNLEVVNGRAPEALLPLKTPTHAFLGGTSGGFEEIIKRLLEKNPGIRVVINVAALESLAQAIVCLNRLSIEPEVISVQVARAKKAGQYHLMQALNPVYILSFGGSLHRIPPNNGGSECTLQGIKEVRKVPRILLAAPSSQSGKTIITCGLLQLLKKKGLACSAFKCGPDYIDPMFHKYVLGISGGNLDSYFSDSGQIKSQLIQEAAGSRISVIEGVMGYYDGIGGIHTKASSYDIARITKTPVILVVNGKGASLSAAAVVKGFLEYQEDSCIKGVILNRVSKELYLRLKPMIEKLGVALVGYLPECVEADLKSRHLGLVMPEEVEELQKSLMSLADRMEQTIDMERLLLLADQAPMLELEKNRNPVPEDRKQEMVPVKLGVARDKAFCFYYQENLNLLKQMGAELVEFSPLADKKLPDGIQGLLLGGGYPEAYAKELADNQDMRHAIYQAVSFGMPVLAECGGFLYLHQTLEGIQGIKYPMVGVLPETAFRTEKLSHFGYICLQEFPLQKGFSHDSWIKGHEFHYWHSTDEGHDFYAKKPESSKGWECIHAQGGMIAGFPHLYYPSNPGFIADWLNRCRSYRRTGK